MSVLHQIAAQVRTRIEEDRARDPSPQATHKPRDFVAPFRRQSVNIIAEVKLASPSEGLIAPNADPVSVAREYLANGALALSVLTERDSFKGSPEYLRAIRKANPSALLLMKDFMLDEYQLDRALADGADAILIIVALLGAQGSAALHAKAKARGLSALVEVHNDEEMKIASDIGANFIGVNNRDLKTLSVSLEVSERLKSLAPKDAVLIAESGIKTGDDVRSLRSLGYNGFLIGTTFMRSGAPGRALSKLLIEARS